MATTEELARLRPLAGLQLPVGDAEAEPYTDDQLAAYLDAVPRCITQPGPDVYLAAANIWRDKADLAQIAVVAAGGAPLVTSVRQGDAAATFHRPTPLGATVVTPNDPAAMLELSARLRKRSCAASQISLDVLPPNLVTPGSRALREFDGGDSLYQSPRPAILYDRTNPDHVINLPEAD